MTISAMIANVEIDWTSQEIVYADGGSYAVGFDRSLPGGWAEGFGVANDPSHSAWGRIWLDVESGRLRVDALGEGQVENLQGLLEGLVEHANAVYCPSK